MCHACSSNVILPACTCIGFSSKLSLCARRLNALSTDATETADRSVQHHTNTVTSFAYRLQQLLCMAHPMSICISTCQRYIKQSKPWVISKSQSIIRFFISFTQMVSFYTSIVLTQFRFLSRVSILLLTRDIDIVILSVRLSVRLCVCP